MNVQSVGDVSSERPLHVCIYVCVCVCVCVPVDGDGMPGSPAAALHRHQSAALAGAGGAGAADALSSEDAIMHDADGADVAGGYNVGFNEGSGEVDDGFEEEEHLIKTNMGQQIRRISKTMLQQVS